MYSLFKISIMGSDFCLPIPVGGGRVRKCWTHFLKNGSMAEWYNPSTQDRRAWVRSLSLPRAVCVTRAYAVLASPRRGLYTLLSHHLYKVRTVNHPLSQPFKWPRTSAWHSSGKWDISRHLQARGCLRKFNLHEKRRQYGSHCSCPHFFIFWPWSWFLKPKQPSCDLEGRPSEQQRGTVICVSCPTPVAEICIQASC